MKTGRLMLIGEPVRAALATALEMSRRRPNLATRVDEVCAVLGERLAHMAAAELVTLEISAEEAKVAWGAVFLARDLAGLEQGAQLALLERQLLDLYVELAEASQAKARGAWATVNADASKSQLLGKAVAA